MIFKAAQEEIVGGEVAGRARRRAAHLGGLQGRLDDAGDTGRHPILQVEYVFHRTVEAVGPEMRAGLRLDQLGGDPHPIAALPHAAFEHIAHAEVAADLLHIDRLTLVGKGRVAGDDEQPADAREGGDDLLDHAVGEIFLLGVARQVLKRQDSDRRLVGQRRRRRDQRRGGRDRAATVMA